LLVSVERPARGGVVELLTIGAFARRARLTPKALRIYADLGLLAPAAVDAESGYRFYYPDQLDRARLVAELRRVGMPLARIREVVDLPPDAGAEAIKAYWAGVEAQTAARGATAAFLVDVLTGRGKIMSVLNLRYAARTDAGHGRPNNDDFAYAGDGLLAVADGVRGHTGAAETAVGTLSTRPGLDLSDLAAASHPRAGRGVRRRGPAGGRRGRGGLRDAGAEESGRSGDGYSAGRCHSRVQPTAGPVVVFPRSVGGNSHRAGDRKSPGWWL
jgi:DNA-binding transcriptional MerR regulator